MLLALFSTVLAFVPGFDVLSFYFCLPMAVLLGMACGGLAVTAMSDAREQGRTLLSGWVRILVVIGVMTAVPLTVILVNAVRVEQCDVWYGLLFYAVGPVLSAVCGAAVGGLTGALISRRRLAHLVFCAIFLAFFVDNGLYLYREPAVFFYNPFLGYFPGAIYDDFIEVGPAYGWYRALCLAGAVGCVSLSLALVGSSLRWHINRRPLTWAVLGASIGAVVTMSGMSGELGFRVDRADTERELSGVVSDRLCEIHYDPSISPDAAGRVLNDCGFRHAQAAAFFGMDPGGPIRVYLYGDMDQKSRLMGARRVEISKPWLEEVHITVTTPGDHVLGHEIAHVIAGRLAPGPLAVPAELWLMADMAVVEGLAEASAFARDGPSPHELALAMTRAGLDADPAALFGASSFLTSHAGRAYTVAGSFIRFIRDVHGTGAVRAIASGNHITEVTGQCLTTLASEWLEHIEDVAGASVRHDLVNRVSGRFAGPGVLGRRCPVDTARHMTGAGRALDSGDVTEARQCIEKALVLDPGNRGVLRGLARLYARSGDDDGVMRMLVSIQPVDESDSRPVLNDLVASFDALAMLSVSRGEQPTARALAYLDEASALVRGGHEGRGIGARRALAGLPPGAAEMAFEVLSGMQESAADALSLALLDAPDSPMVHYLLGKALVGEEEYQGAISSLLAALELGLPDRRFEAEAEKVLGKAAFWDGRYGLARVHLERAVDMAPYQGDRLVIREYMERIELRFSSSETR